MRTGMARHTYWSRYESDTHIISMVRHRGKGHDSFRTGELEATLTDLRVIPVRHALDNIVDVSHATTCDTTTWYACQGL
jgi:hypothetical protein